MEDPIIKEDVTDPSKIKEVTLNYCKELLTNRAPKDDFVEDMRMKQLVHDVRMEVFVENDLEYTTDLFKKSLKVVRSKGGEKYKEIINGGSSLLKALDRVYRAVWKTEIVPEGWKKSVLLELDKGKQNKKDLYGKRLIHLKEDYQKLFGNIVMSAAKPNIMKNMPTNQIGTVPGHQAQENIFILKSVIAHYEESKNSAVVQFFDISKFFD